MSEAEQREDAPAVQVEDLVVQFGSFRALRGVSMSVDHGEVVGLLGENGAGKSTLIKVLSGVYHPSGGQILQHGTPVDFVGPREAIDAGIATVHQHSMLVGTMTVAENLVLGSEPAGALGAVSVSKGTTVARARAIVEDIGIELPLTARVEHLSLAQRQLVEIVRAASQAQALMILDEPTAALEPKEVEDLFRAIRHLRDKGIPVLYISHRLDEIPQICDRVVILRDGQKVGELHGEECIPEQIIPILAGRALDELFPPLSEVQDAQVLEVAGMAVRGTKPLDLTVRKGEVVGLTGATGAGQRELARAIGGIGARTGTVRVLGSELPADNVPRATAHGVAYLSGDRAEGVFPDEPVWRNAAVGHWNNLSRVLGFITGGKEKRLGMRVSEQYKVRAENFSVPISSLSGGNQQKVLIGRWASTSPDVLILDEPTLGVDVGARREIYDLIAEQVAAGTAVLLVSADHAELQAMSHRVLVFADGDVVAEMPAEEATEEAVLAARTRQEILRKDEQ